ASSSGSRGCWGFGATWSTSSSRRPGSPRGINAPRPRPRPPLIGGGGRGTGVRGWGLGVGDWGSGSGATESTLPPAQHSNLLAASTVTASNRSPSSVPNPQPPTPNPQPPTPSPQPPAPASPDPLPDQLLGQGRVGQRAA